MCGIEILQIHIGCHFSLYYHPISVKLQMDRHMDIWCVTCSHDTPSVLHAHMPLQPLSRYTWVKRLSDGYQVAT